MLNQDEARSIQTNIKNVQRQKTALENTNGTFRAPVPGSTSKFKRGFVATYGDVQQAASVQGNVVTTTTGKKVPLKQIKPVTTNKLVTGAPVLNALEDLLENKSSQMSLTRAADLLKQKLPNYATIMRDTNLADLLRLAPSRFLIEEQPHGKKTYYYVTLK